MYISVDKYGNIEEKSGLNNPETFLIKNGEVTIKHDSPSLEQFRNGQIYYEKPYFSTSGDRINFISLPASFCGDIFISRKKNREIILSDNFYFLASKIIKLNVPV